MILVGAGVFDRVVDFAEEVGHFAGPGLVILLLDEGQFPQVMGIA